MDYICRLLILSFALYSALRSDKMTEASAVAKNEPLRTNMTVRSSVVTLSLYPFLRRVFPLRLATLVIIVFSSPLFHWAIGIKKPVCNRLVLPGNTQPSSLTSGGPVVPLFCGFRRRDNLLVWRESFTNLHELKSRIWFLDVYIIFERIYRVFRFNWFSSHIAKTFQE